MDHHVAYLPPPGLPVSTEHNPIPQVSQNSNTSAIVHQNYAMYGHAIQQQASFVLDAGKQMANHGRHDISHEGDRQNHSDLRHTYQSDFIGLAKVTEGPYSPYGPADLSKNYQRVVDPTRSNMDFSHGFPRHLPPRTPNDLHLNLQKSVENLRQTKSFTHHGIHPSRDLQIEMANHRDPLEELQRGSPSLQVIDATKRVRDNQPIRTAKDRGENLATASSFRVEEAHDCDEQLGENQHPPSQRGSAATTPWEQIVGVAATRREETMVNERSPHRELQVEFPGMASQRHSSPVNPENKQQTGHGSGLEELTQEDIPGNEEQSEGVGEESTCDDADGARNKETEGTKSRSDLCEVPVADEDHEVVEEEEGDDPSSHSVEAEDVPKKNINLLVDEKWEKLMRECGFAESHSDFADFLLNWYNSTRGKEQFSEELSSSVGATCLDRTTSASLPEMTSKESQTDCSCSCTCHQEQRDSQTSKSMKKPRRISRQRKSSSQQVVIIAGVDESSSSPSCLPSEGEAIPPKSRTRTRRTSSVGSQRDRPQIGAQSQAGRRTPRKRKLNETSLPYSPVPIFKTKPFESQAKVGGKGAHPTKVRKRNRKSSQRTAVMSTEGDSSFESGVDADDRDSDEDFLPPHRQSDSEDDSKPLKFHLPKLRSRSMDRKNSTSGKAKDTTEYVMEHDNHRAPLKITFKQNRKLNVNESQAKKTSSQTSGNANCARKPRKPAKPKKAVRAKRPSKTKVKKEKEEGTEMEQVSGDGFLEDDAEEEEVVDAGANEGGGKSRVRICNRDVIKVSWMELVKQYQCKICQYDTPCITDMCLHLLDSHIMVIKELLEVFSETEITCSSRTASIFEFLTGKKYDEVANEVEESGQHKRLPPVSGILSSVLTTPETDSRVPPTSEIVMTALSQALPPVTNAMALLHGGHHSAVFGTLGATGTLPYIAGLTHPTLGDVNHTTLHGGTAGYPTNFSQAQDGGTLAPNSIDTTVSLLNAAVTSQANTTSQVSSETDGTSISAEVDSREKSMSNFNESTDLTTCQTDSTGSYQEKFMKSSVDVEELSKEIETDQVIDVFEKWVKIRTQCPHCSRNIRVSKRSNMHRCKGSDNKPVYVLCDVCGNSYQKEYFSLHYNRLHLQSLVSCHICNKKFTASSLPKHLFKHTNPPAAFKCGTCTKSFRFRMDLERHELVHRVDKPYVCATCGRGFTQKSNMQYHMRQHTGEKPYNCDNCMKSFTHNVSLKNHLKKHHGIDLWAMGYTGGGRPKKEQRVNPSVNEST